ncbi:MAG: hypothetical protein M3Z07_00670, partial [Candidatus Eremiobacteraeota bacterium]|nr:hypothetical protein [Candidatus Eremiobacteraeota bacterium]
QAEGSRIGSRSLHGEIWPAGSTLADALRRPTVMFEDIATWFEPSLPQSTGERVAIELKCAGYVARERLAVEKAIRTENAILPDSLDYAKITALSREAREKLARQRPHTLGGAGRIPGVTPSDVAILSLYASRPHGSKTPVAT